MQCNGVVGVYWLVLVGGKGKDVGGGGREGGGGWVGGGERCAGEGHGVRGRSRLAPAHCFFVCSCFATCTCSPACLLDGRACYWLGCDGESGGGVGVVVVVVVRSPPERRKTDRLMLCLRGAKCVCMG